MNYGALEIELAERLNAYFSTNTLDGVFRAQPMPEKQSEQNRDFEMGVAYVQYFTSSYNETQSINEVSQHERITIRVSFSAKSFRGDQGVFTLMEHTKRSFLGYQPQNCTKRLTLDKNDLLQYENNEVNIYLDFKTETLNVQLQDPGDELPLFKNLTIESQCQ